MQCGERRASFCLRGCVRGGGAGGVGKAWVGLASTGHTPWADGTETEQDSVTSCSLYWCVLDLGRGEDQRSSPQRAGEGGGAGVPLFKPSHRSCSANSLPLAS